MSGPQSNEPIPSHPRPIPPRPPAVRDALVDLWDVLAELDPAERVHIPYWLGMWCLQPTPDMDASLDHWNERLRQVRAERERRAAEAARDAEQFGT